MRSAGRAAAVIASALLGAIVAGCGGRVVAPSAVRPSWMISAPWNRMFQTATTPLGRRYGPLAVALTNRQLVIADSFRERLLVWTLFGHRWTGPRVLQLPRTAPIVAVAASGNSEEAFAAAQADGDVWWSSRTTRRVAELARAQGPMVVVTGLAVGGGGTLWVDETEFSPGGTHRALWVAEVRRRGAEPRARRVASALLAGPSAAAPPPAGARGWLVLPAGQRQAIATGPRQSVWVVGGGGGPHLYQLSAAGHPRNRGRRVPPVHGACDLVGVGPGNAAYFAVTVGPDSGRLAILGTDGRLRWTPLALDPGRGPVLGQYAAVAPDGALVTLRTSSERLSIRWYSPRVMAALT